MHQRLKRPSVKFRQIFTSGQWKTESIFRMAIFPFADFARRNNSEISFHADQFVEQLDQYPPELVIASKKFLRYLSNKLASKDIVTHSQYATTAFLSDRIFGMGKFDGILYPSVRADYLTYNIALPRHSVEKITFDRAAMFELFANGKKMVIDNVADGISDSKGRLFWNRLDRTSMSDIERML